MSKIEKQLRATTEEMARKLVLWGTETLIERLNLLQQPTEEDNRVKQFLLNYLRWMSVPYKT